MVIKNFMNNFEKHQVEYTRKDIPIQLVEYRVSQFPAHWHLDTEMIFATEGTINVGYNLDLYTLNAGDFMLIPGGNIHHFNTTDSGRALLLLFAAETALNKEEAEVFSVPVIIRNTDMALFKSIYNQIFHELMNADKAYKIIIRSYLGLISGLILRNRTEDSVIKSKHIKLTLLNNSQNLFKYVEENYNKKITLETGAELMHFDIKYFCRYFKALTGTTFARYVNIIRSRAAQNILKTTDLTVKEIALKCGFNNVRTFNREFKAVTGLTASQYRQDINFE